MQAYSLQVLKSLQSKFLKGLLKILENVQEELCNGVLFKQYADLQTTTFVLSWFWDFGISWIPENLESGSWTLLWSPFLDYRLDIVYRFLLGKLTGNLQEFLRKTLPWIFYWEVSKYFWGSFVFKTLIMSNN